LVTQHDNKTHKAACINAESTREGAVSGAIAAGGGSAVVAAAVKTAEIAFYRAVIKSAIVNGQQSAQFGQALRDLGAGGA